MEKQLRSAQRMVDMLTEDSALMSRLKKDPVPVLKEVQKRAEATTMPAYFYDKWLYRIALGVLSILAIASAIGSIVLVLNGFETPEVLVALGSAAVGALVGLFAPSPTSK